jgi:hypothetical protein
MGFESSFIVIQPLCGGFEFASNHARDSPIIEPQTVLKKSA